MRRQAAETRPSGHARSYVEGTESIFKSLTFAFHNRWVPLKFLAHRPHPSLGLVRSLHFTIACVPATKERSRCR